MHTYVPCNYIQMYVCVLISMYTCSTYMHTYIHTYINHIHTYDVFQISSRNQAINQAYVYQNEILKKDLMQVRMQCSSLQKAFDDVQVRSTYHWFISITNAYIHQRQLDGSALRITELEQQVVREEFRYCQYIHTHTYIHTHILT